MIGVWALLAYGVLFRSWHGVAAAAVLLLALVLLP